MKPLAIKSCAMCNCEVKIFHKKRLENKIIFCSQKCYGKWIKQQHLNCVCPICGAKFHVKPYRINKTKINYCSRKCHYAAKMEYMKGNKNHQYGLKGVLNSSWKSDRKITNYGYYKIRDLTHPFRCSDDMVFEHRLVAEKFLLNDENSVEIDGKKYLRPDYYVHHIDGNKLNNNLDNLVVMTKAEHTRLHNYQNPRQRNNNTGKFI